MDEAPLLSVRGLSAGYGRIGILSDIDLDIRQGEIVAVVGANGAGKTTLNRALSGLIRPTAGSIRFGGEEIAGAAPDRVVRAGLIHVPEGRKIFPNLSVRDNLILGSWARGKPERADTLAHVLDTFPRLKERLDQRAGSMSGGEQQMLAIGRGLMGRPRLLILDEPSLGLSPLLTEQMFDLVARLRAEGLSLAVVEQNVAQSLAIADRAYVVENGRVVLSGAAATVAEDPMLRAAYLGL